MIAVGWWDKWVKVGDSRLVMVHVGGECRWVMGAGSGDDRTGG